jgi:hypothetical protein
VIDVAVPAQAERSEPVEPEATEPEPRESEPEREPEAAEAPMLTGRRRRTASRPAGPPVSTPSDD